MREGRVANVTLVIARAAEVGRTPEAPADDIDVAAAVVAAINADIRGPYRMWVARGRAVFVRPEPT